MSVNPGWGGQPFIDASLGQARAPAATLLGENVAIEVDGGVDPDTAAGARERRARRCSSPARPSSARRTRGRPTRDRRRGAATVDRTSPARVACAATRTAANGPHRHRAGPRPPLRRRGDRRRRAGRRDRRLRALGAPHRHHGPVGLRQVDAHAPPRRPRPPDGRAGAGRGHRHPSLDDKRLTELRREKFGFIFQFFNLLPVLSAEENIVLPLSIAGRKRRPGVAATS